VYEPVPPVAAKLALYVPPTIALGTVRVETVSGGLTVMLYFIVALLLAESVT
jgi:hypothetical protein